jgi:toxin CcdB
MAQFDVHSIGESLVVDCQHNALSHLDTRVVIPLLPQEQVPAGADRLHPTINVKGRAFVLGTQFLASLSTRELKRPIASIESDRYAILSAIDLLLTGT